MDKTNIEAQTSAHGLSNYQEITHQIEVIARPYYIKEKSQPEMGLYFFAYHIQIINHRPEPVQLIKRHWIIRNGKGREEHVKGEGVIGKTPSLQAFDSFEYTSFCPLPTPSGSMRGTYEFLTESGESLKINIPVFWLRLPESFPSTVH